GFLNVRAIKHYYGNGDNANKMVMIKKNKKNNESFGDDNTNINYKNNSKIINLSENINLIRSGNNTVDIVSNNGNNLYILNYKEQFKPYTDIGNDDEYNKIYGVNDDNDYKNNNDDDDYKNFDNNNNNNKYKKI